MWSFVEKLAAIGKLFGMQPSASAPAIIQMGLASMGLDPDPRGASMGGPGGVLGLGGAFLRPQQAARRLS